MKKFLVSILCTAVFFIGLGSLVEKSSAKFKSDEKALALIAQARQAIGGDANIKNVRGMTIIGNSTHTFVMEGTERNEGGKLEINLELPGKFSKKSRIGNLAGAEGDADVHKEFDVIITKRNGDVKNADDGKKVVIVKKGDGTVLTEDIKPADGERKIILKKEDGTVREIKPGDKDTFVFERAPGAVWKTENGKTVVLEKERSAAGAVRQNEMFRTLFALLLSAPEGTDANYLYAGEATVDGYSTDVIEVRSNGSSFKLYLDKFTHLPRMLSYAATPAIKIFKTEKQPSDAPKDTLTFERKLNKAESVEHQVKFSDFRYVGSLQLPHRWTQTVGGKLSETIEITGYEINPPNISEKFREPKAFIRTQKAQQ